MAKKILTVVDQDFEDLEFWYPILRLREEGYEIDVAAYEKDKEFTGKHGVPAKSDIAFSDVDPKAYDGLLVPGGWAPDKLRRYKDLLEIVKVMDDDNKVIGQICHAGWVLASADILKGKKVTSTPGIKDDVVNAGASWTDEVVVVDRNLVSSRKPDDLPYYMAEYIKLLKK